MTTHTLLILDSETLKPENSKMFMRSGSLTALKKLSEHGFLPTGNLNDAGPDIIRLLTQEHIAFRVATDTGMTKPANPAAVTSPAPDEAGSGGSGSPGGQSGKTGTGSDEKGSVDQADPVTISVDTSGKLKVSPGTAGSGESMLFSDWDGITRHLLTGYRTARHSRKTGETDISVAIRLDGSGESSIDTGIPFYDHMLEQIARHGYMDLEITCRGDLEIDEHHTIEDTAITLGEAIGKALGDKRGIGRYGFLVAMDETRALAAIDLSGRPWCVFEGEFRREKVGEFPTEMTTHFFHSLAMALKATLHVSVKGENDHHKIEACFKALARSLRQAVDRNEKYLDILPSSKGLL